MKIFIKMLGFAAIIMAIGFLAACSGSAAGSDDDNYNPYYDDGDDNSSDTTPEGLTIDGLPPSSSSYTVYVFNEEADISSYDGYTSSYSSGKALSFGSTAYGGNVFPLRSTSTFTEWAGEGSLPVFLSNPKGSYSDSTNPIYSYASVSFSKGTGYADFSSFTLVRYAIENDILGTWGDKDLYDLYKRQIIFYADKTAVFSQMGVNITNYNYYVTGNNSIQAICSPGTGTNFSCTVSSSYTNSININGAVMLRK